MSFSIYLIVFELIIILAYGLVFSEPSSDTDMALYPFLQDVSVMVFIGFGLLMTFPKAYGFSAMTFTFVVAVMSIQIYPLMKALVRLDRSAPLAEIVETLIAADFAAAAGLITLGVVLGKTTLLQSCLITLIMIPVYTVNEYIGMELLHASDVGGSITIHAFAAFFGLACSKAMNLNCAKASSSYTSDIFSMMGTMFLFVYWPSFNAALADEQAQARSVLNTFMSLTGSVLGAVIVSRLARSKLEIIDVQNATLAGGVVMGASCDMRAMNMAGAISSGFIAGGLSSLMFARWNQTFVGDTCGVLFLHGIPGFIGGIISAIVAGSAVQIYYLSSTIIIALVTGCLTGLAVRTLTRNYVAAEMFCDKESFLISNI